MPQTHPGQVPWRTRAGASRPVEHATEAEVEAAVAAARERYVHGARAFRLMRVTDPDGNLRIIDFETDRVREDPALAALAKATDRRTIARRAADSADAEWREEIRKAWQAGVSHGEIARAAGITIAHVQMVLRGA
jgi:hypothetical protein